MASFGDFHLTAHYADIADTGALNLEPGTWNWRDERCPPDVTYLTNHSFNLSQKWLRSASLKHFLA
jgi:hypothetical protein